MESVVGETVALSVQTPLLLCGFVDKAEVRSVAQHGTVHFLLYYRACNDVQREKQCLLFAVTTLLL